MVPIDGKLIAQEIVARLKSLPPPRKFLGAVLVGGDAASEGFLKQKAKVAEELGIEFRLHRIPVDGATTDFLREEVGRLARPKTCGGLIVQLPLPQAINKHYVLNAIPKGKDPDMLSETALGAFYTGRSAICPPSVGTVEEIVSREGKNLRECKAVLMGSGFLTGKPIGFWLQSRVAELTILDEHAHGLRAKLKDADIVISGAGVPRLFSADDVKDGALIIDFGWNKVGGKTMGDFDSSAASERPAAADIHYTSTPGGTGPILVAKLFENFYKLNGAGGAK